MTSRMHGTLTVPYAGIIGAVSYARSLGVLTLAATTTLAACVLTVEAPEKALVHIAQAQTAGRLEFVPASLSSAMESVDRAARQLTGTVRGTLAKRRAGRAFCREHGIPVFAARRSRTLALDVEVSASMLVELATLEAMGELTFSAAEGVAMNVSADQAAALSWSARAALLASACEKTIEGGYGLLVAAALVRVNGARPMRESFAA